jgi:hypothetical protein
MREITVRRPLAITDLMIAVALVGLALFLITRPIHGRPELEPGKGTLLNLSVDWAISRVLAREQAVSQLAYSLTIYSNVPFFDI